MKEKKKIITIILVFCLFVSALVIFLTKNNNNENFELIGRWTSTRDSLIKVIKEYNDGQPVYANENVVEYWLDLKKDGKYVLYFNDVVDQSRSDYNIEKI